MVVIDKFDNVPSNLYNNKLDKVVRIGSSKMVNDKKIFLLSIDIENELVKIDKIDKIYNSEQFAKEIVNSKDSIFFIKSQEEYEYFLLYISFYKLNNVKLFSTVFLIKTQYINDIDKNFEDFKKIYNKIDKMIDISNNPSLFKYIWNNYHYKIEQTLRTKNMLDSKFIFGIKQTYSEVFKMLENRKDRLIYVLDVNSMYPFCITMNNYSEPKELKYYDNINILDILDKRITNGLFDVKLKRKVDFSTFIDNFHYLQYTIGNNHFKFKLDSNKVYRAKLHANEIVYYSKYFDIEILNGLYSKKSIEHPLKNDIIELYKKRQESTGLEKDLYKSLLVMISSIMFKNYYIKTSYNNWKKVLQNEFYIKNFNIFNHGKYFEKNSYINIWKFENIISLFSQMYANSNIYMMNLLEKFYNSNIPLDICYVNIDSIHISIDKKYKNKFEKFLSNNNLIGNQLGQLKIEAIGNRALWLDIGKYWIKDNNNIMIKDVNYTLNNSYIKKDDKFVSKININLFKSLTYNKKLYRQNNKEIYLNRFNINELIKIPIRELINSELSNSYNKKTHYYKKFFKN